MTSNASGPRRRVLNWLENDVKPEDSRNDGQKDIGFPTYLLNGCLKELRGLCLHRDKHSFSKEETYQYWNEFERLYLWAEYFEEGKLEEALQYSDKLRNTVLELLSGIAKMILSLSSRSATKSPEGTTIAVPSSDLTSLIEKVGIIVADRNDQIEHEAADEADRAESDSETSSIGEDDDLSDDIQLNTKCLMQLVPALQSNITFIKKKCTQQLLTVPKTFRVSGPAGVYVSLAQEKFPKADLRLVQRLGESNWQRHVRIRDHLNKPEEDPDLSAAHSIFLPARTFRDSGLGTTINATSEYAASAASHTSFASSIQDGASTSARVPSMPREVLDCKPFKCSICGCFQSKIRNRVDWKIHVFADLEPYICTFSHCDHGLVRFATRTEWADHEFSCHRFEERWSCPDCGIETNSPRDWEKHVIETHPLSFTRPNLLIARDMARNTKARPIETEECLLCREAPVHSRRAFVKHVGRHMEELALLALPRDTEDDFEGLSDASSQKSDAIDYQSALQEEGDQGKYIRRSLTASPMSMAMRREMFKSYKTVSAVEDQDYTIKCVCRHTNEEQNTIWCDGCGTWQHTECYYLDENDAIPSNEELEKLEHYCVDCRPRYVDKHGATRRQEARLERIEFDEKRRQKPRSASKKNKDVTKRGVSNHLQ